MAKTHRYTCSDIVGLGEPGRNYAGDFKEYFTNLARTPINFYRRARVQHTLEIDEASGHAINVSQHTTAKTDDLKKEMNWGATVVSYAIAGLSAILSSMCYSEYAVDYPIAGGSFTFMLQTFGEFPGWIAASNIVFNYILANAAVARSFSGYFASLINHDTTFFAVNSSGYDLDFWAFGLILVLSVLLCWGIKETKTFNNIVTVLHVSVVIFIIIAGLTQSKGSNMTTGGFAPFGVRGVFNGASLLFFSYVGFDAIATTAEEVKNPGRDIPIGMTLALVIVTTLYFLCSITLTLMLPYQQISPDAAFSQAFVSVGMKWASYIVALGALLGIVTGTMVGLLAVARSVCALGREHFLPPVAAWVHPKTQTPIITTAVLGIVTAIIALFTSFDSLLYLVSICTLFTFYMIACGILYRHWYHPGVNRPWFALFLVFYFTAVSLALAIYYQKSYGWVGLAVPGILWGIGGVALMFVPQVYRPKRFSVPLMPWIPIGSIILNIFLLGTIASPADQGGAGVLPYKQWGVFMGCAVMVYLLYSLPSIMVANRIAGLQQGAGAQELAYMESGEEVKMGGDGNGYGPALEDNNGHGPAIAPAHAPQY